MKPNRDLEYLGKLQDYYAQNRVLPSFSGIAKLCGLGATSAVAKIVGRLKEAGFLDVRAVVSGAAVSLGGGPH